MFRGMLFGPLKEERMVIEVKDTTHEAFNTLIKYIYKPPASSFCDVIHCPQKFFDLVDLAEKYEIFSLKEALTSNVLKTVTITEDTVVSYLIFVIFFTLAYFEA